MPLINYRAGAPDFSGFDRLAAALDKMSERRDENKRREALQKAIGSLIPEGPRAAQRKAAGLPALGPKKQAIADAAKADPDSFFPLLAQHASQKRQTKIKKREELDREGREAREFDRQLALKTAAEKEIIAARGDEQRKTRGIRGPSSTDLRNKARAQEIRKTLEPFASSMPGVAALLAAGKKLRPGDRASALAFQDAAQQAAEELRVRKGALFARDDPFAVNPLTDDERTELSLLGPIKDSFVSDVYETGTNLVSRRGGGGGMGMSMGGGGGLGEQQVPRGTGANNAQVAPAPEQGQVQGQEQAQAPDRVDAAIEELYQSGADVERIAAAIAGGDKSALADLHLTEADGEAFLQRVEQNQMASAPPEVQQRSKDSLGMQRTGFGSVFGAAVEGGGALRNIASDLLSRVKTQGGGDLAQALGIRVSDVDPLQARAQGELTARAVQGAINAPYKAIGETMAPMGRELARGGREALGMLPQAAGAGGELLAQTAMSPLQLLVGYLQNTPGMARALESIPEALWKGDQEAQQQFGRIPGELQRGGLEAAGQFGNMVNQLGGMEQSAMSGFRRQFPAQPAPSIEELLGLVRPETLPMAQPNPGENIFGKRTAIPTPSGGLSQEEIEMILEFLAMQGGVTGEQR